MSKRLALIALLLILIAAVGVIMVQEGVILREPVQLSPNPQTISPRTADASPPPSVQPVSDVDATVDASAVTRVRSDYGLLVWVARGEQPGRQLRSESGEIVLYSAGGPVQLALELPVTVSHVHHCGDVGVAPGGDYALIYTGDASNGDLYQIIAPQAEARLVQTGINRMSCIGGGTAQISSNGERFAFLDYPGNYNEQPSPTATLRVFDAEQNIQRTSIENAAAFALKEQLAYVSFFKTVEPESNEAGVHVWDGQSSREVATLYTDDPACFFTSAGVAWRDANRALVLLSHRCPGIGGPAWRVYQVDVSGQNAALLFDGEADGRYFPFTQTSVIYAEPGGGMLFTSPDGVINRSVSVLGAQVQDERPEAAIDQYVVMPHLSTLPWDSYNHSPLSAPNDSRVAFVRNDPDNNASLVVIPLANPTADPITVSAGGRGDLVRSLMFASDSRSLYAVLGGSGGTPNALHAIDLQSGTDQRLIQGRFEHGIISPDGQTAALMEWVTLQEGIAPVLALGVVDLRTGHQDYWFRGGRIISGELREQSFAYPLAWLQNS